MAVQYFVQFLPGRYSVHVSRTNSIIGDLERRKVNKLRHILQLGIVDLGSCVAWGVIVGMETCEEEDGGNLFRQERPLIASFEQILRFEVISKTNGEVDLFVFLRNDRLEIRTECRAKHIQS